MLRSSKILFWAIVAILLLWQVPWCLNFIAAKSERTPFIIYSTIVDDFVMLRSDPKTKDLIREDRFGNSFTEEQFDSILPSFYLRQLVTDERFPDSIKGVAVTPKLLQTESFTFRNTPAMINRTAVGLYPLLESMSGRVDLAMPDDAFRITGSGIEFIDMESNSVNREKSNLFTEAMLRKGFRFPATEISGNPTDRKDYDEGYVLLDADGRLFHLKQTRGRPYCRAIELPDSIEARHLFITEFRNRRSLALMTDARNRLYVIDRPDYKARLTAIPHFDPEREAISIIGNMFDWTVCISDDRAERYYALDTDGYSLLDSLVLETGSRTIPGLRFTSPLNRYVIPHFE